MQYSQASIGRVFIIKVEHKEDLLEEIKKLAIRENIEFATLAFIGAMTKADIVAGPEKLELPAVPVWISFGDGREVLGFGTIVKNGEEVNAHIHASFGKGDKALTGCLRKNSETFITVEAVITELTGVRVAKRKDDTSGHEVLFFD